MDSQADVDATLDQPYSRIDVGLRRVGEKLEIRIEDNGPGVADVVREKLFAPFVSYGKENGTGMGLTVVQKIVQDHGGDVVVERTSATGTTSQPSIWTRAWLGAKPWK